MIISRTKQHIYLVGRYIIIGFVTTLISFGSFWLLLQKGVVEANIANSISVITAVLFAFIANKIYVFKSVHASIKELSGELFRFILSRGIALLVEIIGLFILYSVIKMNVLLSKVAVSLIVLTINYISMYYVVFKVKRT